MILQGISAQPRDGHVSMPRTVASIDRGRWRPETRDQIWRPATQARSPTGDRSHGQQWRGHRCGQFIADELSAIWEPCDECDGPAELWNQLASQHGRTALLPLGERDSVLVAPTVDAGDHYAASLAAQVGLRPWDGGPALAVQSQRFMFPRPRNIRDRSGSEGFQVRSRSAASSWLQPRSYDAEHKSEGHSDTFNTGRASWSPHGGRTRAEREIQRPRQGAASETLEQLACLHLAPLKRSKRSAEDVAGARRLESLSTISSEPASCI